MLEPRLVFLFDISPANLGHFSCFSCSSYSMPCCHVQAPCRPYRWSTELCKALRLISSSRANWRVNWWWNCKTGWRVGSTVRFAESVPVIQHVISVDNYWTCHSVDFPCNLTNQVPTIFRTGRFVVQILFGTIWSIHVDHGSSSSTWCSWFDHWQSLGVAIFSGKIAWPRSWLGVEGPGFNQPGPLLMEVKAGEKDREWVEVIHSTPKRPL